MLVQLQHPSLFIDQSFTDVLEGSGIVDRVDHYDASCALVIRLGNVFESLLASRVPDLQLNPFVSDSDCLDLEVHSDCGDVVGPEGALAELDKEVGLADPAISDYYQLQDIVVSPLWMHCYYTE